MARPNRTYVVTLAAVAGAILVGGAVMRPRMRPPEQPVPVETDFERLSRFAERRALESASGFHAEIADRIAPSLVWLEPSGLTGIAWAGPLVATARLAPSSGPMSMTTALGAATARVGDWSPDSPVATVIGDGTTVVSTPVRAALPAAPGAPIIAVWQSAGGRIFAPASFIAQTDLACDELSGREVAVTLPLTRAMSGGGLFDLDGGLLGVIVPCGARFAAVVPDVVDEWIRANATIGSRLLARYGVVVEPLSDTEADFFGVSPGVMVREVRVGGPAHGAGLWPGDVVVAVDGEPVAAPGDLQTLTEAAPAATVRMSVRRGRAPKDVEIAADDRGASATPARDILAIDPPPGGVRIEALSAESGLAAAGLRVGDRVVRVGDRERQTPERIRQALEATSGPPLFIEYERAGRRRGALVLGAQR